MSRMCLPGTFKQWSQQPLIILQRAYIRSSHIEMSLLYQYIYIHFNVTFSSDGCMTNSWLIHIHHAHSHTDIYPFVGILTVVR